MKMDENIRKSQCDILNITCNIQKSKKMDENIRKQTNTYENGQKMYGSVETRMKMDKTI